MFLIQNDAFAKAFVFKYYLVLNTFNFILKALDLRLYDLNLKLSIFLYFNLIINKSWMYSIYLISFRFSNPKNQWPTPQNELKWTNEYNHIMLKASVFN